MSFTLSNGNRGCEGGDDGIISSKMRLFTQRTHTPRQEGRQTIYQFETSDFGSYSSSCSMDSSNSCGFSQMRFDCSQHSWSTAQ
jgi:hypothetical protein